ncbi:MAG: DUF488 domain-containing protein [Planctomycetes bacterium]|nr:DUF488 domain-containing protein [Planctomycetota bacterium]
MLTRQRTVLAVLERVGRPVPRTVLVKCAFLLRHQTSLRDDHTFYDFVPHKYGPFSFALYQELGALREHRHIVTRRAGIALGAARPSGTWMGELPPEHRRAVDTIAARYATLSLTALLQYVYDHYPWYASRSTLRHIGAAEATRPEQAGIAVYTAGYQGRSVDAFFDMLLRRGIQAILDVRANPVSRKYGFARGSLSRIAGRLGVDYHHLPALGIPSDQRSHLDDPDSYRRLLDRYENEILPRKQAEIEHVVRLLHLKPSALLCMEADATYCHRGRLASAASTLTGMPVCHL